MTIQSNTVNRIIMKRAYCSKCGLWITIHGRSYNGNLCYGGKKRLIKIDYLSGLPIEGQVFKYD